MAKKVGKKKGGVSKFRAMVSSDVEQQKARGSKYGYLNLPRNVRVFKEEPGSRVSLDIIPYTVTDPKHMDQNKELGIAVVGEQWYKKPYKIHRGIGAGKESYVCLTSFGKKCPICEYRAKRVRDGDAKDEELKSLRPSNRNLYVVIPLGVKDCEEKPHIWDISQYLFQDKLNEELAEDEDNAVFPDIEEGLTLKIRFSEEKFGKNTFAATSRIDFEEREHSYTEKDLKDVPSLDEVLQVLSYNELEAKFFEYEDVEEEPENATSVRKKSKVKVVEEDEDEDDADEETTPNEDEEDDEEDTSDEDEEDEDADDEDEDDTDEDDDSDDADDDADDAEEEEDEEDAIDASDCVACKGTGKNSKGKPCSPCKGTGKKQVATTKKAAPKKATAKKTPAKKKDTSAKKQKCPHGYVFGVDCEDHDECDDCVMWDDCIDAKEA